MKLLVVSRFFYPRVGGGEMVSWQIFSALARKGHRIYVITSKLDDTPEHEETNGLEIYRPFLGTDSVINGIGFSVKLFSYLKDFLNQHPVDIVFSGAYSCTIPASYVGHRNLLPSITYVNYFFGRTWFRLVNPLLALFNYMVPIIVLYFGNYDAVCCPSKEVGRKIQRYTKSKVVVIPNPIDIGEIKQIGENTVAADIRANLGIKDSQRFLLFVGRLSPEKNVDKLIETLHTFDMRFKLIVVGDGPERPKIEGLIKKLGMDEKVKLAGQKSHEETLAIMKASDVVILPSKTEVFPAVVIEALALGKPVIATRVGGIPEIRSNNLYLVDSLNEIKEILLRGLEPKPDEGILKHHSLEKVASEFEALFEKVLKSGGLR